MEVAKDEVVAEVKLSKEWERWEGQDASKLDLYLIPYPSMQRVAAIGFPTSWAFGLEIVESRWDHPCRHDSLLRRWKCHDKQRRWTENGNADLRRISRNVQNMKRELASLQTVTERVGMLMINSRGSQPQRIWMRWCRMRIDEYKDWLLQAKVQE